jgi:hypothetical protein
VIEKVERVYREITTTRKVIGAQGQVLENTQDVVSRFLYFYKKEDSM